MRKTILTIILAMVASVGTMFAWDYERVQIGDLYYNLDATNKTAEVTCDKCWNSTNYSGLTTANIPSSVDYESVTYSVTEIDDWAFDYCTGLTSITIPNSVTSIGNSAFYYCTGLKSVTIPNSVTWIGNFAFYGCTGLTSVVIGNSVTEIDGSAFAYCSGLTSITCEASTPPACESTVFNGVDKSIPLYVLAGSEDAYEETNPWKDFTNVLPIQQAAESTVTEIEAEPTKNSVVIEWPKVDEATVYTIEIKKSGELICTLTFNELGQLQNIAFAKPSRNGGHDNQVRTATQTTTGWKYTVAGLEPNTTYSYNVIAKRNASDTDNLYDKTITFTTKNAPTDIDAVVGADSQSKQIRNGQLLILSNGGTYNAQGVRVE